MRPNHTWCNWKVTDGLEKVFSTNCKTPTIGCRTSNVCTCSLICILQEYLDKFKDVWYRYNQIKGKRPIWKHQRLEIEGVKHHHESWHILNNGKKPSQGNLIACWPGCVTHAELNISLIFTQLYKPQILALLGLGEIFWEDFYKYVTG